jgi:hypothetical protein
MAAFSFAQLRKQASRWHMVPVKPKLVCKTTTNIKQLSIVAHCIGTA